MATLELNRADPTGILPDDDPLTSVPLATPDRAILTIGTKMFGSSDLGFISRSNQNRLVGTRSNGRFGSTQRSQPSHGQSIVIPFEGTRLPAEIMKKIDQFTKDAIADLIFRKYLIVTEDGGPRFTPDQMRNYV